jgi:hypothetical protein
MSKSISYVSNTVVDKIFKQIKEKLAESAFITDKPEMMVQGGK